jgi:hypothetical protein
VILLAWAVRVWVGTTRPRRAVIPQAPVAPLTDGDTPNPHHHDEQAAQVHHTSLSLEASLPFRSLLMLTLSCLLFCVVCVGLSRKSSSSSLGTASSSTSDKTRRKTPTKHKAQDHVIQVHDTTQNTQRWRSRGRGETEERQRRDRGETEGDTDRVGHREGPSTSTQPFFLQSVLTPCPLSVCLCVLCVLQNLVSVIDSVVLAVAGGGTASSGCDTLLVGELLQVCSTHHYTSIHS